MTVERFLTWLQYQGATKPEDINPDRWEGMLLWLHTRLDRNEALIPDGEEFLADEADDDYDDSWLKL